MVWNRPFSGAINEDPYERLQEFEELHSDLVVLGITQEAFAVEIVSTPSYERAEQWYTRMVGSMSGDWKELRVDFCHSFSLTKRINSLPIDIVDAKINILESKGNCLPSFRK